ncbi:MAG TPA: ATP-binding protein [Caldilineae bacterium]|nr:ATP-binding protein [Caldilineae bacterium]
MIAFHTIAIPHADILSGRLTMDVFAADLWEVFQGRAPDEYRDPERFFQKTYLTEGLEHLLAVVEKRLRGQGGDPVIQIQTPFGGGKTHALIAMYHKAEAWGAHRVVAVGTAMNPTDTLWGLMAEQLTGTRAGFEGMTAPGREAIRDLLAAHQPLLILMDEVLEYATKAAGVPVGDSTLAAQTLAFLQELSEAAGTLDRTCLVVTLPASVLEHYDENAERLFQQIQKVAGRVEKIYTPVQEHEISQVIRRRLFARIDQGKMAQAVNRFLHYAEQENLLPAGVEPSEYRERFLAAYPFLPEVIDILYQRWGSFASFQRTRGVLRLLSLVIFALKERDLPYITLADFDLSDQEIRRELLKHIGPEFDSVIAADITDASAGARKVDQELGDAYRGLRLGTRAATTIFMYSFSGGVERGATLGEIKRHATTLNNPSSVIAEALELLKNRLFFLQQSDGKVFFSNQPNLNRILLVREENIHTSEIEDLERQWLRQRIRGQRFKVYIWPGSENDIPDTSELKLIILREHDGERMRRFLERKGVTPRVHRNTLFFLVPMEYERVALERSLRRYAALRSIERDRSLNLTPEQRNQVKEMVGQLEGDLTELLRRAYRLVYIPARDGDLRELDMGTPTYGTDIPIDEEVYEKLRTESEILEGLQPLVLKERYLRDREYVLTRQLVQSWSQTPGALRVVSEQAWRDAIAAGVQQGLFGLGELEDEEIRCRAYKESPLVALAGNEIIIRADICEALRAEAAAPAPPGPGAPEGPPPPGLPPRVHEPGPPPPGPPIPGLGPRPPKAGLQSIRLHFTVPKGQMSNLLGVLNLLHYKFNRLEITLRATEGEMSEQEYEDKIKEAFRQMGIEVEEG